MSHTVSVPADPMGGAVGTAVGAVVTTGAGVVTGAWDGAGVALLEHAATKSAAAATEPSFFARRTLI
jgi:hypothetical protein